MDNTNLLKMLEYIDPASCDYQEWVNVGMALKHEGYSVNDWDSWSRSDSRYHSGECEHKWQCSARDCRNYRANGKGERIQPP